MQQSLLNDAALALSRVLMFHRIQHGFFGGFAILAKGGLYRESKDLDVLVHADKATIVSILSKKRGWVEIPHGREDYVAFFWKSSEYNNSPKSGMVLVEMFTTSSANNKTRFPPSKNVVLKGNSMGTSYVPILSEEMLLRGKLNAAAARAKPGDILDIVFLIQNYGHRDLKTVVQGVDKRILGQVIRRYPQLRKILERVGVHTRGAMWAARKKDLDGMENPNVWDVQCGLGWVAPPRVC